MGWIVVDGMDGSGKTTVARWIGEHYRRRGAKVLVQVHPSSRFLGRMARRSLQSSGKLMYAVSSVFFILDVLDSLRRMRRWREGYEVVVFVRYLLGTAYLPDRYIKMGYALFTKLLPVPEMLLLVDVEPQVALQRIAIRDDTREMFENLPALTRVRSKILMLTGKRWKVLDNNGEEERTREALEAILTEWDSFDHILSL